MDTSLERQELSEEAEAVYRFGYFLVEGKGRKRKTAVYVQLAANFDAPVDQACAEAVARSPSLSAT